MLGLQRASVQCVCLSARVHLGSSTLACRAREAGVRKERTKLYEIQNNMAATLSLASGLTRAAEHPATQKDDFLKGKGRPWGLRDDRRTRAL